MQRARDAVATQAGEAENLGDDALAREGGVAVDQQRHHHRTVGLLGLDEAAIDRGALILLAGLYAPASFMSHFIVFVLSCFVGFQVIWNVSHSLHTPLMAVTNAISSIIILGALMQIGSGSFLVILLAALSVFMAGINIFGGFMVTRRMLAMFQKS